MANYKSREERRQEILTTALGQLQGGRKTFTLYTMAKWTGVKPSTHYKQILDALWLEGKLTRTETEHRPNVVKHVYRLSETVLEEIRML